MGIRFIYNDAIDCLHNDAAADLGRYCLFQERGASDTVFSSRSTAAHIGTRSIARVKLGPATPQEDALRQSRLKNSI